MSHNPRDAKQTNETERSLSNLAAAAVPQPCIASHSQISSGQVPYETHRAWLKWANICSYLSNWDHCRSNRPLAPDTVPMFVMGPSPAREDSCLIGGGSFRAIHRARAGVPVKREPSIGRCCHGHRSRPHRPLLESRMWAYPWTSKGPPSTRGTWAITSGSCLYVNLWTVCPVWSGRRSACSYMVPSIWKARSVSNLLTIQG